MILNISSSQPWKIVGLVSRSFWHSDSVVNTDAKMYLTSASSPAWSSLMSVPLLSNGPTEDLTVVLDRAYLKKVFESFFNILSNFSFKSLVCQSHHLTSFICVFLYSASALWSLLCLHFLQSLCFFFEKNILGRPILNHKTCLMATILFFCLPDQNVHPNHENHKVLSACGYFPQNLPSFKIVPI